MDFERIHFSDEGNFAITTFTDEEAPVLRGTFCEKIQQCVSLGNTESFSEFDRFMTTYGEIGTRAVKLRSPDSVARPLMEFYENTDDAMMEIAHSAYPAFLNSHIAVRQILGEQALKIAKELIASFPDISSSNLSDYADAQTPDHFPEWFNDPK